MPLLMDAKTRVSIAARLRNTAYAGALARVERRVPWWSPERVERLQRYRLRRIVHHAYETVPFYRREMDARRLKPGDLRVVANLARLLLINGADLVTAPTRFLAIPYLDARH